MKTSLMIVFAVAMTFASAAQSNSRLLIGDWQGPNSTTLVFEAGGAGHQVLSTLECTLKMKSWSASGNILTINWDMTPIRCKNNKGEQFTHTPKIEVDKPLFTISQENVTVNGLKMIKYTLVLDNKEFNSKGTYFRFEMPEE
jgi:hypothetical protein